MTKNLWKDLGEVYEMMGHHARVIFSTLPCSGKEDNDIDAANVVDVADNAVDVDDTMDVADVVLDVVLFLQVLLLPLFTQPNDHKMKR